MIVHVTGRRVVQVLKLNCCAAALLAGQVALHAVAGLRNQRVDVRSVSVRVQSNEAVLFVRVVVVIVDLVAVLFLLRRCSPG